MHTHTHTLSLMLSAMSRKVGRLGCRATWSRWIGVNRLYVSLRSCRGAGRCTGRRDGNAFGQEAVQLREELWRV